MEEQCKEPITSEDKLQYLPLLMASFTSATVENVAKIQFGSMALQIAVYLGPGALSGEHFGSRDHLKTWGNYRVSDHFSTFSYGCHLTHFDPGIRF